MLSPNELPPNSSNPILYSFRRCPYAMRARMAIHYSGVKVELREILLRDKPADMLRHSPKATVPVLVLPGGAVIDESLDVMRWALAHNDPDKWLLASSDKTALNDAEQLIADNDVGFKAHLDQYKYADRFPEHSKLHYRQLGEGFLERLEMTLLDYPYLMGERVTVADIAVFPFIRQFAFVDQVWFFSSPYQQLQKWLNELLNSHLFLQIMQKHPVWKVGDKANLIP